MVARHVRGGGDASPSLSVLAVVRLVVYVKAAVVAALTETVLVFQVDVETKTDDREHNPVGVYPLAADGDVHANSAIPIPPTVVQGSDVVPTSGEAQWAEPSVPLAAV